MTAEPTGELREALGRTIAVASFKLVPDPEGGHYGTSAEPEEVADALLSGPLAPLLAKLRAVEELAEEFDANGNSRELGDPRAAAWHKAAARIRAALDAEAGQ